MGSAAGVDCFKQMDQRGLIWKGAQMETRRLAHPMRKPMCKYTCAMGQPEKHDADEKVYGDSVSPWIAGANLLALCEHYRSVTNKADETERSEINTLES